MEELKQVYCFHAGLCHEVMTVISSWSRDTQAKCACGCKSEPIANFKKNGNILHKSLGFWLCLQQEGALAVFPCGYSELESGCPCPPRAEHASSTWPMVSIILCCSLVHGNHLGYSLAPVGIGVCHLWNGHASETNIRGRWSNRMGTGYLLALFSQRSCTSGWWAWANHSYLPRLSFLVCKMDAETPALPEL